MYMVRFEGGIWFRYWWGCYREYSIQKINKLIIGSNNGLFYSEVYSNTSNEVDALDTASK